MGLSLPLYNKVFQASDPEGEDFVIQFREVQQLVKRVPENDSVLFVWLDTYLSDCPAVQ